MFNIPARYLADSPIEPKTFIQRDMKKAEKDRIRENLLDVRLKWQLAGEDVPSLIDESYNCSVIMGFDIKLKAIKESAHFADLIHRMVKAPCVIRFHDTGSEIYSFVHKRLSRTDATQVVVEDRVETPELSLDFPGKATENLHKYLSYDALRNKTDKLSLYLEATVKAFIISNPKLYSGTLELLEKKLWYNRDEVLALFDKLLELKRLNEELKVEKLPGERAKLMGEIKSKVSIVKGVQS